MGGGAARRARPAAPRIDGCGHEGSQMMMAALRPRPLIERLPAVRGRLTANAPLAAITWFRVGGPAEVMFRPADLEDLQHFLAGLPTEVPVTIIGVGSNLLVRDGGVPGVALRLG